VTRRGDALRAAIKAAGGGGAVLPVVLIENSGRCRTNAAGEKELPNGIAWLQTFMTQVMPGWRHGCVAAAVCSSAACSLVARSRRSLCSVQCPHKKHAGWVWVMHV
jgi:hypothetical protein